MKRRILTGTPGAGKTSILRLLERLGHSIVEEAATAVIALRLYVSEWTTGFDQNGPSPNGDVMSIPWGGGTAGRHVIGAGVLHFPGGVGVDEGGLYVSNWSIATGEDGPFGPGNHGQLLRFALDD
jgi:hypothetical protein